MKFGRNRPSPSHPRLRLGKYLLTGLPAAPATVDYSGAAASALARMYANDRLGCCVVAGGAHLRGVTSGNAGETCVTFTDEQIVAMYGAIGGYVPGDPSTDQGCDELTALSYLTATGYPDGVKLSGSASVDAASPDEVRSALWLFENVIFGMELPDAWVTPMPSSRGFIWDVAGDPVPSNGHCVVGVGYTEQGVIISTWGMLGLITWAAVAKYATPISGGELHVAFSPDMLARATGRAPTGFDFSQLASDLVVIGGTLAAP